MATFEVPVVKVTILPHENADTLEIAQIFGYTAVVQKGLLKTGDLAAYIPEQSLVPETVLETMNLKGRLGGAQKNRVVPIKLRGVLSQGLLYPAPPKWVEGQNVAEELGITKWEPHIPAQLAGEVASCPHMKFTFDVENIKKYPNVLREGELVYITEKIHGTCLLVGGVSGEAMHPEMVNGGYYVSSKGQASKGLYMKDNQKNTTNTYMRAVKEQIGLDALNGLDNTLRGKWFLLGEVFGRGVQDLSYATSTPQFRAFGIWSEKKLQRGGRSKDEILQRIERDQELAKKLIGENHEDVKYLRALGEHLKVERNKNLYEHPEMLFPRALDKKQALDHYAEKLSSKSATGWLDFAEFQTLCMTLNIPTVPVLYHGPLTEEARLNARDGKETISGNAEHIREGVVIYPEIERQDVSIGRAILKDISPAYLLRKDGTEFQ